MVDAALATIPAFPEHAIQVVPTTDRAAVPELLSLVDCVDLCMPRGGESLIRAVTECSKVPVIKHYKGVCHVYVDGEADAKMAREITLNSKLHRVGVCNAIETLLVDQAAAALLPELAKELLDRDVELRLDPGARKALNGLDANGAIKDATEADWSEEYLDKILAVRVVDGVDGAISHINEYGSGHSDTIVTSNAERAQRFQNEVDSAAVYWNASTRFTDGGAFGMGAEIGISTDKIGARGPMGLEELTSYKWIGTGTGQIRE
jgi:glutamate-5-semialdehyde dehydrogenase